MPITRVTAMSPAHRPKVLITGVAGYIGGHTALACLDAGWEVVGIDDFSVGEPHTVPQGIGFHKLDCADTAVLDLLAGERPDAAIHFAARIAVGESVIDPYGYYVANVVKAAQFFDHVAKAGLRALVFSSTAAVYGDVDADRIGEDQPTNPTSPYGRSKLAAEWILRDMSHAMPLPHVILRYFNVAGADPEMRAGPRKDATHLIKKLCEAATGQSATIMINGTDYPTRDGTCLRDFVHVCDVAAAHLAAVTYLLDGGESTVLNCGYGGGFTVREVIDRARRHARVPFTVEEGSRRVGDTMTVIADPEAIRERLGWTPKYRDLDEILRTAIAWEERMIAGQPLAGLAGSS